MGQELVGEEGNVPPELKILLFSYGKSCCTSLKGCICRGNRSVLRHFLWHRMAYIALFGCTCPCPQRKCTVSSDMPCRNPARPLQHGSTGGELPTGWLWEHGSVCKLQNQSLRKGFCLMNAWHRLSRGTCFQPVSLWSLPHPCKTLGGEQLWQRGMSGECDPQTRLWRTLLQLLVACRCEHQPR